MRHFKAYAPAYPTAYPPRRTAFLYEVGAQLSYVLVLVYAVLIPMGAVLVQQLATRRHSPTLYQGAEHGGGRLWA